MGKLSSRVQRVSVELQQVLRSAPAGPIDLSCLRDPVAKLVLEALDDEDHPLSKLLDELRQWIEANAPVGQRGAIDKSSDASQGPRAVMTARHFFMPQPGTSLPVRRLWPLQLLLYTTALSSQGAALAERLGLTPAELKQHAAQAEAFSVALWSPPQHAELLRQAVALLDYADPPNRLEGRKLLVQGHAVRLSAQQAIFVRVLFERAGQWVTHAELREAGVNDPVKLAADLTRKLRTQDAHLDICSRTGAYMVQPS